MKRALITVAATVGILAGCSAEQAPVTDPLAGRTAVQAPNGEYMSLDDQLTGAFERCRIIGVTAVDKDVKRGNEGERRGHYRFSLDAPLGLDAVNSTGPSYSYNDPVITLDRNNAAGLNRAPAYWADGKFLDGDYARKMPTEENNAPKLVEASANLDVLANQNFNGHEVVDVYVAAHGSEDAPGAQKKSSARYCGTLAVAGDKTGLASVEVIQNDPQIPAVQILNTTIY